MVNRPPSANWQAAAACVRGAAHVREGLPNQDACSIWPEGLGPAATALAAVSDGHGGARHFRSAQGAGLAVTVAREQLRALSDTEAAHRRATLNDLAGALPGRLVAAWRAAVQQHLAAHPITPAEWQALADMEGSEALASVQADPLLAYGATLLVAWATPAGLLLLQLGDGDALVVAADGSTHRPIPADDRLGGNLTTSLCRPDAAADCRVAVLTNDADRPALVLLSTDGYANSFRTDADFLQVGHDYLQLARQTGGLAVLAGQLPGILEEATTQGSGDDITLALLASHADAAALGGRAAPSVEQITPEATGPAGPTRSALTASLDEAHRRLRRVQWVAGLLAAVVLVVGLWVTRPLWSRGPGQAVNGTSTPASSQPARDPGFAVDPASAPVVTPASDSARGGKPHPDKPAGKPMQSPAKPLHEPSPTASEALVIKPIS